MTHLSELKNHIQDLRQRRGITVARLAALSGVTRQTIYSIENGVFIPNTLVGLKIAKALGVNVEEIFRLEEETTVEAAALSKLENGQPVRLCSVNGKIVAAAPAAFPTFFPASDGVVASVKAGRVRVQPRFDFSPQEGRRLLIAGCDPALSLLSESLAGTGIDIVTTAASSRTALGWLKARTVHVAGSHLLDRVSGEYNLPFVKQLVGKNGTGVVTFAHWEQGLVLKKGNPLGIRSIADLADRRTMLINREVGAGSRDLLDNALKKASMAKTRIRGYDRIANSHLAAAYMVAAGSADCCVATGSAARHFGLDFIPLAVERFDLALGAHALELPAAHALLDLLNRGSFRQRLSGVAAYDTSHTGEILI